MPDPLYQRIVLVGEGHTIQGIVASGQTFKPGMLVQRTTTAANQGYDEWTAYNADADGGRPKSEVCIVTEDLRQGKTVTDSFAAGEWFFGYCPLPGDKLQLLCKDVAGTGSASDFTKGEVLIPDDTFGTFILTAGSPETEMAVVDESQSDLTADTLVPCRWTGY